MELLEKTRALTGILNNASGADNDLEDICAAIAGFLEAEARLYDITGKNIAVGKAEAELCIETGQPLFKYDALSLPILSWLVAIERLISNVPLCRSPLCINRLGSDKCELCGEKALFSPVYASGNRMATLLLVTNREEGFSLQDEVLVEIASSACGSIIQYSKKSTDADASRNKSAARNALSTLSYSEMEATTRIFSELNGVEGVLVASRIAEQAGITRSAIVSALRKLESAGIIESRSLGMKGTFIRIKNEQIMNEFEKARV